MEKPDVADAEVFGRYRPLLVAVAYRMLGSVMDVEDIVQEAFPRWQHDVRTRVASPKSYLTTVVTRLCIDHLRSARVQREDYIGPWLPEPLVVEQGAEDAGTAGLADSLSLAFLVLLESLSPLERAVFLLHDVFAYSYDEIAPIVGKSAANCRQLAVRARRSIEARRPDERLFLVHRFWVGAGDEGSRGPAEAGRYRLLRDDPDLLVGGTGRAGLCRRGYGGRGARLRRDLCPPAPALL